ncbi:MAG: endopeptidase La [Chitinophagales bacterium]
MFEEIMFPFGEEEVEFLPMLSLDEDEDKIKEEINGEIPILPLRNTVLFPGVVIPITVGRDRSIKAVKQAHKGNKILGVIAQRDPGVEDPESKDLSEVGTIAKIVKMLKMPDGSSTVIIQGKQRFKIEEIKKEEPYIAANVKLMEDELPEPKEKGKFKALISSLKDLAGQIVKNSPNIPSEAGIVLKNIDSATFLMHFISSNLNSKLKDKQSILESDNLMQRAELVLEHLNSEFQMLELKNKIQSKVKTDLEKQQKDFFLQQQLKTIQEELGRDGESPEIKKLKKKALKMKWGPKIKEHFEKEVEKLQRVNQAAAEYSINLNYLELLLDLPWGEFTKDDLDLKKAKTILDKDHYGLDKIKERILEYLAVLKLKGDMKSPILCFVGPPGVGKTSLGRSIARAINRKYIRMSLGGLHDESEIRGHRKTYIGAMPGRVVQSLKKVKSSNPVFILDEIDKVGKDFRGDPSSALLEVLDPEQNHSFYDNYLELEYDLSNVMFIATANSIGSIQPALRDRMEVIQLSGYSVEEKVQIAKKHLIPRLRQDHGLKATDIQLSPGLISTIIEKYTRESGVRELERQLASVMRSVARKITLDESYSKQVKQEELHEYLGPEIFDRSIYSEKQPPGVAVGLAWTQAGGEILFIESSLSKGKETLTLTGNLGDVMKESATTALSYIRSHADELNIDPERFKDTSIHIHVPEGAIPKDGPSAGVTLLSALTSAFTGKRLKPYLAMTGEITLRGRVLPVGGIKEKILAAKRAGLKEILLCKSNEKHIKEIDKDYLKGLKFHYVEKMQEVIDKALV